MEVCKLVLRMPLQPRTVEQTRIRWRSAVHSRETALIWLSAQPEDFEVLWMFAPNYHKHVTATLIF